MPKGMFPKAKDCSPKSIHRLLVKTTNLYTSDKIDKEKALTVKTLADAVMKSLPAVDWEKRLNELEKHTKSTEDKT